MFCLVSINGSGSNDPIFQFDAQIIMASNPADIIDPTSGGFTVKDSGAVNTEFMMAFIFIGQFVKEKENDRLYTY